MRIPLELDIWLQSYDAFVNTKNITKQNNLNTVFANISSTIISDIRLIPLDHVTYPFLKKHIIILL